MLTEQRYSESSTYYYFKEKTVTVKRYRRQLVSNLYYYNRYIVTTSIHSKVLTSLFYLYSKRV